MSDTANNRLSDVRSKITYAVNRFLEDLCNKPAYADLDEHVELTLRAATITNPDGTVGGYRLSIETKRAEHW